ncbi:unnamed protein product [Acanthoscelides obtectus]|uniref:Uncharacterized protein n=1 Tax=Acanthoscelides obtectus TaxID=200917 RepID=A0A9P0KHR1_ACAOB|nr:unnamed protein product [Acanthoscelides obtectus]CAK1632462.1 hypothetical protein AOBTE_LOCUS7584 [Acanthoscelides obtectus]
MSGRQTCIILAPTLNLTEALFNHDLNVQFLQLHHQKRYRWQNFGNPLLAIL